MQQPSASSAPLIRAARAGALCSALALVGSILSAAAAAPASEFTEQSNAGSALYAARCAVCHGATLKGGSGPTLVPPTLPDMPVGKTTAADLSRWIRLNMPLGNPGSLSQAESHALAAFIAKENGSYAGPDRISSANAGAIRIGLKR